MLTKLDSFDQKILHLLQSNGRLPNVELAAKVGLSESPCLRRVKALEASGLIKGYRAVVDHRLLGLDIIAFIHVNLDQRSEDSFRAFNEAVAAEPAIIESYAITGGYDHLLKVAVRDLDEFAELTLQRILRYPGVDNITSEITLKNLKENGGYEIRPGSL